MKKRILVYLKIPNTRLNQSLAQKWLTWKRRTNYFGIWLNTAGMKTIMLRRRDSAILLSTILCAVCSMENVQKRRNGHKIFWNLMQTMEMDQFLLKKTCSYRMVEFKFILVKDENLFNFYFNLKKK